MSKRPSTIKKKNKLRNAKTDTAPDAPAPHTVAPGAGEPGNTYLYGVIRWPPPENFYRLAGEGVGGPPRAVRLVRAGPVAGVVSHVWAEEVSEEDVRSLRRDMKAHSAVLNRLAEEITVLPARFGVVLPDDHVLVQRFLEPQHDHLLQTLANLEGCVELTLRATYIENQVLREVVEQRPDLVGAGGGRSRSMAQESRIEAGRQVAAAIGELAGADARWLLEALSPVVRDVQTRKPLTELNVLNASLLVERKSLKKFDRRLEEIYTRESNRMQLDCVGPLPPFSFVDLRL